LRALNGVELWHVEELRGQGQRVPTIRYMVVRGGSEAIFNRPHEAWEHFRRLTNVPDKDTRPELPQIDEALLRPRTQRAKPKPRGRSQNPK
jgi:hypothetical protein